MNSNENFQQNNVLGVGTGSDVGGDGFFGGCGCKI
jgi:hypothetical protein